MPDAPPIRRASPPSVRLIELDAKMFPGCALPRRTVWWQGLDDAGNIAAYTALEPWGDGIGFLARSWVHPDWRGQGLQRRMIRVRERYARANGIHKLVSYTANENCPSANSLIRCGYRTYTPQSAWGLDGCTYWFKLLK